LSNADLAALSAFSLPKNTCDWATSRI